MLMGQKANSDKGCWLGTFSGEFHSRVLLSFSLTIKCQRSHEKGVGERKGGSSLSLFEVFKGMSIAREESDWECCILPLFHTPTVESCSAMVI